MDRESKSKASLERVEAIESDLTKTRNKLKTCMRRSREDRDAWQLALETMKTENRSLVIKLEASKADLKRKEELITKLKSREDDEAKTELIATLQEKLARLEAQAREFQRASPLPATVSPIRSVAEEEEEEEKSVNVSTYTPRRDYTSGVYDLLKAFEDEDRECDGTIHVKRFVHILQSRAGTVPAFKVMARPEELSHLLEMFGPDRGMEHERIDYPAFVDFVMGSYKSPNRSPSSSPTRTPLEKKKKSAERSYISSAAETVRRQRRSTTTTPSSAPATTRRREQMKIASALWRRRRAVRRSVAEIDGENDDDEKGGILLIIVYNYGINFFKKTASL